MKKSLLSPDEIIKKLKDTFKNNIKDARIEKHTAGSKKREYNIIWIKIDKSVFKKCVKYIIDKIDYPHLAVVSGNDLGKTIELIYHFSVYYGNRLGEISINLSVDLPKEDPRIESICDLIPGALITEREKQEMLGVIIEGIPDRRRFFIPDEFPDGIYPWRKDDKMLKKFVKDLYEEGKK
jgi:membrane-bound hydrogenase subunit beta